MATVQNVQQGARVTVLNATGQMLTRHKTIDWSGKADNAGVPQSIMPTQSGEFSHFASPVLGSKGLVVFTTTNNNAWVLAWEAPNDAAGSFPNKVFVYTDTTSNIDGLTDNQLLQRLNQNGAPNSNSPNPALKITAQATIAFSSALNMAVVQANFGVLP